ncbi:hypothetical protein LSH36_164g00043 [Paralvinella palmiformis]|uniref:Transmembrane protein 50A n=1 Tax=Paralvinella palmiformis TaxID=53620 RepID=A0AAD9N6M3_9ANNE|nr:hypothetical protein LSH36_164g00043 [Paralvinella palmiformis]
MSGCLDNCRMPECEWLNLAERRNAIATIISGGMFFIGWWLMIDALAVYQDHKQLHPATIVCGVVGTIALFMVNSVSNAQIRGESYNEGCLGQTGARVWLFIGFMLGFGALIASSWVLFGLYVVSHDAIHRDKWPGIAVFLHNTLIFFGSLIFKFGRTEDLWG